MKHQGKKKISKTEGKINWDKSAEQIIANINGLYPNPGAGFILKKTDINIKSRSFK